MRAGVRNIRAEKDTVGTGVQRIAVGTRFDPLTHAKGKIMNSIVYLVGAVVIILAILSFIGLR